MSAGGVKRILFFGEPATLAHVVRPVVLARTLDPKRYRVAIATGADFRKFALDAGLEVRDLYAIGTRAYLAAVAGGRVVFPYDVLERYVHEDLRHLKEFQPDVVVGDFRLSLAVSARLAKVPYLAISNAYWAPGTPGRYQIPAHPLSRIVGVSTANGLFRALRPFIIAHHSFPMHRLRRRYGMPSLGFDLRRVFTEADLCLLADVPEMVPMASGADSGRYLYIGPITWSPEGDLPPELQGDRTGKPLIYLTMGSSGDPSLLQRIVQAALSAGCRIALATGDQPVPGQSKGVFASRFLPGAKLAAVARLVICNGGSPSTHQALEQGTPVLGIPSNLDQLLNMQFITRWGAGLCLRADQASSRAISAAIHRLLSEPAFRSNAGRAATAFRSFPVAPAFRAAVEGILGRQDYKRKEPA